MPRNDLQELDKIADLTLAKSAAKGSGKRHYNRPHWKDIAEQQSKEIIKLEQELARLRSNGAEPFDLAKIKAEAFAAGVASVSKFFTA